MMTPCILNVPVRIPHLQPSNLRRKGFQERPVGPLGLVSEWPATLVYSTTFVVPAMTQSASGHGESAVRGIERRNASDDEEERELLEVYSILKSELLHDPAFKFTVQSRQWLHRMLDYNVSSGNLSFAFGVIRSYRVLQGERELSEKEIFLAYVLGWCNQWLISKTFVIDDIKDHSYTRRGQPCWFRLPEVGMIATNDAAFLQAHVFRILKKHFSEEPYYVQLLDLFNEMEYQTSFGEMLDSTTSSEKDLSKYSPELHHHISTNKTYPFMWLPVACALILAGERLCDSFEGKDILVDITAYYQMKNDYMDCFGDPAVTGQIGTDIEDGKCTWLIVKALGHANEQHKKILYDNYGKFDPACVAQVKQVYESLDLQNMCKQYMKQRFQELKKSVEMHPSKIVQGLWATYAGGRTTYC